MIPKSLYLLLVVILTINSVKSVFIQNRGKSRSKKNKDKFPIRGLPDSDVSRSDFKQKGKPAEVDVTNPDGTKVKKVKVNQYYKKTPIFGASLVFEYAESDTEQTDPFVDFGIYYEKKYLKEHIRNTKTKLTDDDLGEIIATDIGSIEFLFDCSEWIYFIELIPYHSFLCKVRSDLDNGIALIPNEDHGRRQDVDVFYWLYVINAQNGDILEKVSLLHSRTAKDWCGNPKIGFSEWAVDLKFKKKLKDPSERFKIIDMEHTNNTNLIYQCDSYSNCDGTDSAHNGAYGLGVMAFKYATDAFDCFKEYTGDDPVDDTLQPLKVRVHFKINHENAFWNGDSVTFGDGYNTYYPLISIDVMAHELAHGYTEQNSGLIKWVQFESGGIDEAYADLAGKACEFKSKGTYDWNFGADIYKADNTAIRYMNDPTADGRSIDDYNDYVCGMDEHYSAGVFNKAFTLMVDNRSLPIEVVFEIATHANKIYWTPQTTMAEAAQGMISAAQDLHGFDAANIVEYSFEAVNVIGENYTLVACVGCTDNCGDENTYEDCWCDLVCTLYGDCCQNKVDVCGLEYNVPYHDNDGNKYVSDHDSNHYDENKYLVLEYMKSNYVVGILGMLLIASWLYFCFKQSQQTSTVMYELSNKQSHDYTEEDSSNYL